ncbi:BsuPI-related putative proteinase inhibitor [Halobacillus litoralis]|uniref:BsuPI-related putative proteinase inhibitor n=1 Tax=Halobacillus litoralis TaxID=45668 RepID=UPI001CFEC964|nr:BsuPI-related putative proteinase inhibitor [Halobacillus litoralis]
MKRISAIIIGCVLLILAACTNDSEANEVNGEEGEAVVKDVSDGEQTEIDMEALIDQLAMDAAIDSKPDKVTFNFSLENKGDDPLLLGFTSSQKYDIQVKNAEGEVVYTYSANRMFAQGLTTEDLGKGDVLSAEESWNDVKESGEYEATMTFLVNTINDQPMEANPFQVTQSFTVKSENAQEQKTDQTGIDATKPKSFPGDGKAFRDITISGDRGSYIVKGQARVIEGSFLYSVEDGHNVQVKPTPVQVEEGAPAWSSFEISINIPEASVPEYGMLTLTLFEKSGEDGRPMNVNYIPLDQMATTE